MNRTIKLACACDQTHLEVDGAPILGVECCCTSCREAGARLRALPDAPQIVDKDGKTRFALYRKDRVRFTAGAEKLKEFRLAPKSKTRRVVASCCNTPVFLEFQSGHWLSIYAGVFPQDAVPPVEMRTMTIDLPDASVLRDDVPNAKRQSASFMGKLLWAWIAMGFRAPKVSTNGEIKA